MMGEQISGEQATFDESDFFEQPPKEVFAFNELRSCADLHRMAVGAELQVNPDFQREVVWKSADQTRFIDSLMKQLPIPSLCFSLDVATEQRLVIDGLQRISSVLRFLSDEEWVLSRLGDVDPVISGVPNSEFRKPGSPLNQLYKRVQNATLPITVIRCDYSKPDHMDYLFTIFHRLNTGGTRLTNQEIRNCIFSGSFNDLLRKELDSDQRWQRFLATNVNGRTDRFRSIELILRVFAFSENQDAYKGNLAKFLNAFMQRNRRPKAEDISRWKTQFEAILSLVDEKVRPNLHSKIGFAIAEAMLVGISRNLARLQVVPSDSVGRAIERLQNEQAFSTSELAFDLSRKEKVDSRLDAATRIFSEV